MAHENQVGNPLLFFHMLSHPTSVLRTRGIISCSTPSPQFPRRPLGAGSDHILSLDFEALHRGPQQVVVVAGGRFGEKRRDLILRPPRVFRRSPARRQNGEGVAVATDQLHRGSLCLHVWPFVTSTRHP